MKSFWSLPGQGLLKVPRTEFWDAVERVRTRLMRRFNDSEIMFWDREPQAKRRNAPQSKRCREIRMGLEELSQWRGSMIRTSRFGAMNRWNGKWQMADST